MKMNLAIIITSTLLISTSALANGWNVDVFGGKQNSDNLDWAGSSYSTDSGDSYGIGVSKQVSPRLGLGFEVGYTKNEYANFKPNSLSGRSIMLTTEYDFVQRGNFSAYGGLGVGAIKVKYKNNAFNHEHNDTIGGGRLSLGARYAISPRANFFVEARYIDTFKDPKVAHVGGTGKLIGADYKGDSLLLGFRYTF